MRIVIIKEFAFAFHFSISSGFTSKVHKLTKQNVFACVCEKELTLSIRT